MAITEQRIATHADEGEPRFLATARRAALGNRLNAAMLMAVLAAGAVLFMMPLYVMLAISLKTKVEAANTSPWMWPIHPTFANFRQVWSDPNINFLRASLNTLIISAVPTFGTVMTSALVAFPFARLKFRGRDRMFVVLLGTMMLPGIVTLIPGYVLMAKLGWIDTFKPFIVPSFLGGGAFNVFLVRQFMMSIPREMDEAAKIDGATNAVIFWRILLPNCAPVLATIAVFSFVGGFRDFLGPLMMLNSPEMQPLEVALKSLQGSHTTEYNLLMAGSMITTIPLIVVFIFCQRYFMKGITLTGGK
jgi:multiple sugar transport system permease protein